MFEMSTSRFAHESPAHHSIAGANSQMASLNIAEAVQELATLIHKNEPAGSQPPEKRGGE